MNELVLKGIDGANPLGFLAALGVLRTASRICGIKGALIKWQQCEGSWRPIFASDSNLGEDELVSCLNKELHRMHEFPAFSFADDLSVASSVFRSIALSAKQSSEPADRSYADFLVAFGTDGAMDQRAKNIADTSFRTMSGSGNQHFLRVIRQIVKDTDEQHIWKSLFTVWLHDDPIKNHSMRWDPLDDIRYALQWREPSVDKHREIGGSMWGANRLAIEALPLFPVFPRGRGVETTGFKQERRRGTFLTWPIWEQPITVEIARSILALRDLQHDHPDRENLRKMGIVEILRCQRLTRGKYRNFTQSKPV